MKKYICNLLFIFILATCFSQPGTYSVVAYGAVGDGKTISTKALQSAVDACNANGGGEVIIPPGIFITGTVHLKSNVHLQLQSGAILRGSSRLSDYDTFNAGKPYTMVRKGMLFTEDAENITISGPGQIDGNGDMFFDSTTAKSLSSQTTRFTRQKDNYRKVASGIGDGPMVPKERPYQMFVFSNCKKVTIRNVFITNAPFWCMHFADCDAVMVDGIRLWNSLLAPNADGIDITSSTNVSIVNSDIRAGDDAIAVVGYDHHFEIPGFRGVRHPCENIVISNCNLQSYSSGIRIGYLDQNPVRNIQVSNCNITNSTRGIGVFLRDEGSLENISFQNIHIETKLRTGDWWGNGEPIHVSAVRGKEGVKLGTIKNLDFSNITCKSENGILVYGSEESRIQGLSFRHIRFQLTGSPLNEVAGGNIDLRGCLGDSLALFKRDIPGILLRYADDVQVEDVSLQRDIPRLPFFTHGLEAEYCRGLRVSNFSLSGTALSPLSPRIFLHNTTGFLTDNKNAVVKK